MTQLELVAEVGSGPMDVVKIYLEGQLSIKEVGSVLGKKKAEAVEQYMRERRLPEGSPP